jgi:hypothetical protein
MKYMLPVLAILLLLLSCKKEPTTPQLLENCNSEAYSDSTSISNGLLGTWKWTHRFCDIGGTQSADEVVNLTINDDGTFSYSRENDPIITGTWYLEPIYQTSWELKTNVSAGMAAGHIVLCDNQLKMGYSEVDGCDFMFVRID